MNTLKVLKVTGLIRQTSDNGYYSLILEEPGEGHRLQIVIGASEAHSIECVLRKIVPPRPLTHDLMADIMLKYNIRAEGVIIELLPGNIYGAKIMTTDGTRRESIDARSSDAVALAVRLGIPLYASAELLEAVGSKPASAVQQYKEPNKGESLYTHDIDLTALSEKELKQQLKEATRTERYELASLIKTELDRRKTESNTDQ